MKMKSFLKIVWHDPVGSNVIGGLIVVIIVSLATIFIPSVKIVVFQILNALISNPFIISTIVLFVIALLLFRQNKTLTKSIKDPLTWLSHLSNEQLAEYKFLFWFPLNHTLKTSQYHHSSENIDHIPEIRELIDRKVLNYIFESIMYYTIEIDKECYKYMNAKYKQLPETEKQNQYYITLQSKEFIRLF